MRIDRTMNYADSSLMSKKTLTKRFCLQLLKTKPALSSKPYELMKQHIDDGDEEI